MYELFDYITVFPSFTDASRDGVPAARPGSLRVDSEPGQDASKSVLPNLHSLVIGMCFHICPRAKSATSDVRTTHPQNAISAKFDPEPVTNYTG